MGDAIDKARQQVLDAIQARIVETITAAVEKAKAEIAEAVLTAVSDPFDAAEIEGQIADELNSLDWSSVLDGEVKAT